jgi:cobalt/nickel transport system permease protein
MWAATGGTIVYCSQKLKTTLDNSKIPLMGVLGAFIFAAQMINFTIPGTGSSGHLGGGLLLAILLGPHAAFLVMTSVLTVQALFFADGGLLALGANAFNLGIFPCFIVYPLIYKNITGNTLTKGKLFTGAMLSAVIGLQLGAFAVVMQTTLSGIVALPFDTFAMMMQPIHLAIGLVEGLATVGIITFLWKARPDLIEKISTDIPAAGGKHFNNVLIGLLLAAAITGGILARYASENADGLEWSIAKVTGQEEIEAPTNAIHTTLENLQEKISIMPDYTSKNAGELPIAENDTSTTQIDASTSAAGLFGGLLTLLVGLAIGYLLKKRNAS